MSRYPKFSPLRRRRERREDTVLRALMEALIAARSLLLQVKRRLQS